MVIQISQANNITKILPVISSGRIREASWQQIDSLSVGIKQHLLQVQIDSWSGENNNIKTENKLCLPHLLQICLIPDY